MEDDDAVIERLEHELFESRLNDPHDRTFGTVDRDGNPVSLRQLWTLISQAELEGYDYRQIGRDKVGNVVISTVLLQAVPQPFYGPRTPFETALWYDFGGEDMPGFQIVGRWETRAAADKGHAEIVKRVQARVRS